MCDEEEDRDVYRGMYHEERVAAIENDMRVDKENHLSIAEFLLTLQLFLTELDKEPLDSVARQLKGVITSNVQRPELQGSGTLMLRQLLFIKLCQSLESGDIDYAGHLYHKSRVINPGEGDLVFVPDA
jgi:hypothetical protein